MDGEIEADEIRAAHPRRPWSTRPRLPGGIGRPQLAANTAGG